jgi:hypothetical protein
VRKRTQAKQRSDARGPGVGPRHGGRQNGQQVVANIRKNSLAYHPGPSQGNPLSSGPVAPRYDSAAPEGYFNQRPPQAPLGSSPGSSGDLYRPPTTQPGPLPDPSGYVPPQRQQQPLPGSQPPYSPPAPQGLMNSPVLGAGGYPSPRIPVQRPPSQPQLGTPGQPGQHGRNRTGRGSIGSGLPPPRVPSSSSQQAQQGRMRTPSPPGPSVPPARPPPGKGPATFQEMGYQSSKLEEKDCVIM